MVPLASIILMPVVDRRDVLTLAYAASTKQEIVGPVGRGGKTGSSWSYFGRSLKSPSGRCLC